MCTGYRLTYPMETWRNTSIRTPYLTGFEWWVARICRSGPLNDFIPQLRETADAVAYLHSIRLVHGDIKANNILVGDSGEARICDFGWSKIMQSRTLTTYKGQGTVRWQAPELFDNKPKSFETDVYAFGITIFEVQYGSLGTPNNVNLVWV